MTPRQSYATFPEKRHIPYSLTIKGASEHFGFAPKTLYKWIYNGRLIRGVHYLKVGNKPIIIREGFIKFMESENECQKEG